MGSKGDCYDDAVAESVFATLKKKLVCRRSWPTRRELSSEVLDYTEASTEHAGTPPSATSHPPTNTDPFRRTKIVNGHLERTRASGNFDLTVLWDRSERCVTGAQSWTAQRG